MDRGLATVIGMSIAYVASFVGLVFAWVGWRERRGGRGGRQIGAGDGGGGDRDGGPNAGPGAGGEGTA